MLTSIPALKNEMDHHHFAALALIGELAIDGTLNLDAQNPETLLSFGEFGPQTIMNVTGLSLRTVNLMQLYARRKSAAMHFRLSGDIVHASACERECEAWYQSLPNEQRW